MAVVVLRIHGREYQVACDDGQEEQLRLLADEVDDRIRALVYSMGSNPGEAMSLVLTALTMADELLENKKELERNAQAGRQQAHEEAAQREQEQRLSEMEAAMAVTLDDIAQRIETIAAQVEMR